MKVTISPRSQKNIYHTKSDCPYVECSISQSQTKLEQIPDFTKCEWCEKGSKAYKREKEDFDKQICELCGSDYKYLADHIPNCPKL